jgi:hypothetical protein
MKKKENKKNSKEKNMRRKRRERIKRIIKEKKKKLRRRRRRRNRRISASIVTRYVSKEAALSVHVSLHAKRYWKGEEFKGVFVYFLAIPSRTKDRPRTSLSLIP